MGIQLVIAIESTYEPDNGEWEAIAKPILIQTYADYYICGACNVTIHMSEVLGVTPDMHRCPTCQAEVVPKPPDLSEPEVLHYSAPSICEVNSAMETNLLILQREVEQANLDLREAEKQAAEEREEAGDASPEGPSG